MSKYNANPGVCPHCNGTEGYISVGRYQWYVCDEHKTRWLGNYAPFCPSDENETIWIENSYLLEDYSEIKPKYLHNAVYPNWKYGELDN